MICDEYRPGYRPTTGRICIDTDVFIHPLIEIFLKSLGTTDGYWKGLKSSYQGQHLAHT